MAKSRSSSAAYILLVRLVEEITVAFTSPSTAFPKWGKGDRLRWMRMPDQSNFLNGIKEGFQIILGVELDGKVAKLKRRIYVACKAC